MVKLDLGIKELIGLSELGSITKEELSKHLASFDKKDLIDHLVLQAYQNEENEEMEEDKDDETGI